MMKKTLGILVVAVCATMSHASAQMLITGYNFNDGGASGATATTTTLTSTGGSQSSNITTNFPTANTVVFAGTTVNAVSGDVAGNALSFVSNANNGDYFQFAVSTIGYTTLSLSYATRTSGATTGFTTQTLSYSTDGTTFTNFGTVTGLTTSFVAFTNALPTAAEGVASLTIRDTLTGATSATANNRIDNIQLTGIGAGTGVPEPSTYATMVLGGLGALAMLRYRRRTV